MAYKKINLEYVFDVLAGIHVAIDCFSKIFIEQFF